MKPMRVAYSLLFWGFMILSSLVAFPMALAIWLLTFPFDRRLRALHLFTCFWASIYTWLNPAWRVSIKGTQNLDSNLPTIMVANHLSLLDVIVVFRLFTHFKWVSKSENFQVPLIGWNMRLNGYIPLRRGGKSGAIQMMKMSRRSLAEGNSLFIFPEGTRSPDGRMRRFKDGAFDLAIQTSTPIQPLVIQGTSQALPKRGFKLQGRHPISVEVLEVIPAETFKDQTAEDLAEEVQNLIGEHLGPENAPLSRPKKTA